MKINLPNQITLARLVLSVVFFILVSFESPAVLDWALGVFAVACLTDLLDGFLARRYGLVTAFGRMADPFVDKILICGGFALLVHRGTVIAPWMVVVVVCRELLVSSFRGFIESRGIAFGAKAIGKWKTVLQMVALGLVVYAKAHGTLPGLSAAASRWGVIAAVYAALALTVLSGVAYLALGMRALSRAGTS